MKFEFTDDRSYIRECLTQPHVWRMSTDDQMAGINPGLFFVPYNRYKWVKVEGYGLFMIDAIDNDTCRIHVALRPEAKGKAGDICKQGIKWFFDNTSYLNIEVLAPDFNKLACRLANVSGMELVKTLRRSFMKNGVSFDQHLYRINRELSCHH